MPVRLKRKGAIKALSSRVPDTAGSRMPIIQGAFITSIAKKAVTEITQPKRRKLRVQKRKVTSQARLRTIAPTCGQIAPPAGASS